MSEFPLARMSRNEIKAITPVQYGCFVRVSGHIIFLTYAACHCSGAWLFRTNDAHRLSSTIPAFWLREP